MSKPIGLLPQTDTEPVEEVPVVGRQSCDNRSSGRGSDFWQREFGGVSQFVGGICANRPGEIDLPNHRPTMLSGWLLTPSDQRTVRTFFLGDHRQRLGACDGPLEMAFHAIGARALLNAVKGFERLTRGRKARLCATYFGLAFRPRVRRLSFPAKEVLHSAEKKWTSGFGWRFEVTAATLVPKTFLSCFLNGFYFISLIETQCSQQNSFGIWLGRSRTRCSGKLFLP
ncbi:MAG: hypothetical protein KDA90_21440 [Planctomycetaceae bacterium]|nr:hypothetical protein [Planctomycetaceae bacterium]